MDRKPPDRKAAAKRAALRALRRARAAAAKAGVDLTDWEGEFLGSVEDRVLTYGRAFGDPEKGGPGQALSALQTRKLKEIGAKAKAAKPDVGGAPAIPAELGGCRPRSGRPGGRRAWSKRIGSDPAREE